MSHSEGERLLELYDEYGHYKAVADAAIVYMHALNVGERENYLMMRDRIKLALKNLHEEVAAFDEWEKGRM